MKVRAILNSCAPSHTRDPRHHTEKNSHKEIRNTPNHDGQKSCIFHAGAVSRPPKLESYIHSPNASLRQTAKPRLNRQQSGKKNVPTRRVSPLGPALSAFLTPRPPLTRSFASVSAPTARSCSTTAACPFHEARCSGVPPSCAVRQRSIRHTRCPHQ